MPVSKKQLLRITRLLSLLRARRYPNCTTFVRMLRNADVYENLNIVCSEKTIYRDIQVLKNDFHAPIKFNKSRNGYYLTNPAWNFSNPDIDVIISGSASYRDESIILGSRDAAFLPNNKTLNQQAIVSGINSKNDEEFKITCGDDIAPLIEMLNAGGVETFCHDQDDNDKTSTNNQLHLTIKVESSEQLTFAVKVIKNLCPQCWMTVAKSPFMHSKIVKNLYKRLNQSLLIRLVFS